MNSKEIIDGLLRKRPVPRMGMRDSYWTDTLEKWHAEGHVQEVIPNPDIFNEDRFNINDVISFDMFNYGGYFDTLPLRGYREVLEETDEWIITKDGGGATSRTFKHRTGVPEHIDFELTSPEIWREKYRPLLLELDPARMAPEHDRANLLKGRASGKFTYYCNYLFWEQQRMMMGDLCLLESLLLEPEWILDFNEVYCNFYIRQLSWLFEQTGVPDGMWFYEDLAYKNGLFCSPDLLRELYLPFYQRITQFIHGYDIPVIFHSCGQVEKALPIIAEAGFDAINPIEIKAGCDLLALAKEFKEPFTFIGGFDVRILEAGDRAQIRAEIERITKAMREMGVRYIMSSDHSISPMVEFETLQYALEVFQDNMYY